MPSSSLMRPDPGSAADVERLLSARAGRPVRVLRAEPLGGAFASVARMTLDTGAGVPEGGRTVVVETRRRGGEGWGYDAANLQNEEAALRFLHGLGAGVAPQLLAADDGAGVLVMSDVGAGPTVEDVVHARDAGPRRPRCSASLAPWARCTPSRWGGPTPTARSAPRSAPRTRRASGSGA